MRVVDGKRRATKVEATGHRCQNRGRFSLGGLGSPTENVEFEPLERFLPPFFDLRSQSFIYLSDDSRWPG